MGPHSRSLIGLRPIATKNTTSLHKTGINMHRQRLKAADLSGIQCALPKRNATERLCWVLLGRFSQV